MDSCNVVAAVEMTTDDDHDDDDDDNYCGNCPSDIAPHFRYSMLLVFCPDLKGSSFCQLFSSTSRTTGRRVNTVCGA